MIQDATKKITIAVVIAIIIGVGIGFAISRFGSGTVVYVASNAGTGAGAVQVEKKAAAPVQNFTVINNTVEVASKKVDPKSLTVGSNNVPPPVNFKSFQYDAPTGKVISVSGTCSDKYYALVIFKSAVDYRARPDASVFNRAFDCPTTHTFTIEADLRDYNLQSGEYYFFIADQGNGAWYNPR